MEKAEVGDRRFEELRKTIVDCANAEVFAISRLAMENPENLQGNLQYRDAVLRFRVLERLQEKADELKDDTVEALAA